MLDTLILAGLVITFTQIFKKAFGIATRYVPVVAIIVMFIIIASYSVIDGVAINWLMIQNSLVETFTAMGLYSSAKAIIGK